MNKKIVLFDIIFYMAGPFLIWNYGVDILGDYYAMLLSTVPAIIYTFFRFWKEKQFNIGGMFIIGSLLLGTTIDLLSGSAERMIVNGIYLGLFYALIHVIALVSKRPFALYFAVDFAYLQGHAREESKRLFYTEGIFKWFQLVQLLFIVRSIVMAGVKMWLLNKYGVAGYGEMIIYRSAMGWFFNIMTMGLYFYTNIPITKFLRQQHTERNIKDINAKVQS